jgi:hypothetical protein
VAFRTSATMSVQSTSTPQPFWGSWIASVVSGSLASPAGSPLTLTLGTACAAGNDATQLFQPNDPVWLIDPNGGNAEMCRIQGVGAGSGGQQAGGANNITLGIQNDYGNYVTRNPHVAGAFGTGTFIAYGGDVNNILLVYEDGGTGPWLYLGNQYNFTAAYRRIVKLPSASSGTQPSFFNATENFFGAPFRVSELWVFGSNAGDEYVPSLGIL